MPGFVLFGRRWRIGSDKFYIPNLLVVLYHLISSLILTIVASTVDFDLNTKCSVSMFEYIVGFLIINLILLSIELLIFGYTCKGNIFDFKPSRLLTVAVYTRLALCLAEVIFILVGIIRLIQFRSDCWSSSSDQRMRLVLIFIVISTVLFELALCILILTIYDKDGKFHKLQVPTKETFNNYRLALNREMFTNCRENFKEQFRILHSFFKTHKDKEAFSDVTNNLTFLFDEYDLTSSEILDGLLVLKDNQELERKTTKHRITNGVFDYLSGVPITTKTKFFNTCEKGNSQLLKELIYYFDYAAASYGWPLYVSESTCACFRLISTLNTTCTCARNCAVASENGSVCSYHVNALVDQLPEVPGNKINCSAVKESSADENKAHIKVIFVDFNDNASKPSYFVALDLLKRKLVVTIRSTDCLRDSITNLKWNPVKVPGTKDSQGWYSHEGMTKAAVNIKSELTSKRILEKALNFDRTIGTDTFELVVVGHSLGAGVGAVLSILLKVEYPSTKCISYSPPGGLLSQPCMEATKEFITTVVLGKDMIPRLGLPQLEDLRARVMDTLKQTRKPKNDTIPFLE